MSNFQTDPLAARVAEPSATAPNVALPRDGGTMLDIFSLRPDWVVLFFYPKDAAPGCTTEGPAFTALQSAFAAPGTKVIGISKDTVRSHDKFVAKQVLNVPVLSNEKVPSARRLAPGKEKCTAKLIWALKGQHF